MKKNYLLLIFLFIPLFSFSQGNMNIEDEKAAIIKVIEEETNAYIAWDYERWKACYLQDEPFVRLNSSFGTWGGVDNWATYDSAWYANYQIEQAIIPLPIKFENEDYIIKVTPEAAWAVYTENWFDNEGTKTGWSLGTRFLEKQDGEWKISYMGVHNAGTYEQATQVENTETNSMVFVVPQLSDTQKLQQAQMLCFNNIIAGIEFAKSHGISVEEFSKHQGEAWLAEWNQEAGFNGLVNFLIFSNASLSGAVEIIDQTENSIILKITDIYPAFKTQGELLGVTYNDLMIWYEESMKPISEFMGCSFSQTVNEDGITLSFAKK